MKDSELKECQIDEAAIKIAFAAYDDTYIEIAPSVIDLYVAKEQGIRAAIKAYESACTQQSPVADDEFIISEMFMAYVDCKTGTSHTNYAAGQSDENAMRNILALLINKGWTNILHLTDKDRADWERVRDKIKEMTQVCRHDFVDVGSQYQPKDYRDMAYEALTIIDAKLNKPDTATKDNPNNLAKSGK